MSLLGDEDDKYPKFGPNTTEEDFKETIYVLGRPATTRLDMEIHCSEEDDDDDVLDNITLSNLVPNWYENASLTLMTSKIKEDISADGIKDVNIADNSDVPQVNQEIFDMIENWTVQLDEVLKDERGLKVKELKEKLNNHIQVGLDIY